MLAVCFIDDAKATFMEAGHRDLENNGHRQRASYMVSAGVPPLKQS
jgi:hypothetical protein